MLDWTRLKPRHVPWIALAIATVGTSASLATGSAEPVTADRTCAFVPQRLGVERLSPRTRSIVREEVHPHSVGYDHEVRDDLRRLYADLERNEMLKRLVRSAMKDDRGRPRRR